MDPSPPIPEQNFKMTSFSQYENWTSKLKGNNLTT